MRHRLAFSVLALFTFADPESADAQRWRRSSRGFDYPYGIELGLIGSANRNTVTGTSPVDARYRGSGGVFASVPLAGGGFRLRPEVSASGKQIATPQDVVHSFTWLEMPLLFEARFHRALGDWATPKLLAGPFVAVRLACSIITPAGPPASPETKLVQSCDDVAPGPLFRNGDAGFVLGAGVGIGPIGVGFRWIRSLVAVAPSGSNAGPLAGANQSTLALTLDLTTRIR